jgi:hypothetical protein
MQFNLYLLIKGRVSRELRGVKGGINRQAFRLEYVSRVVFKFFVRRFLAGAIIFITCHNFAARFISLSYIGLERNQPGIISDIFFTNIKKWQVDRDHVTPPPIE